MMALPKNNTNTRHLKILIITLADTNESALNKRLLENAEKSRKNKLCKNHERRDNVNTCSYIVIRLSFSIMCTISIL